MKVIADLDIPYPKININGTSKQELVDNLLHCKEAAHFLYNNLAMAMPHPRDWQTADNMDFLRAREGWSSLLRMVQELEDYLETRAANLNEHG